MDSLVARSLRSCRHAGHPVRLRNRTFQDEHQDEDPSQIIKNNKAATATGCDLNAALIAVAAITAMQGLAYSLKMTFGNVSTTLDSSVT